MAQEYIANGATCICKFGITPAILQVKKKTKTINGGKMLATNMELGDIFQPPACVMCRVNPLLPKPCKPAVTQWEPVATNEKLQGGSQPLLPKSKATCSQGAPNCIEIIHHGQFELPGTLQIESATNEFQSELNPLSNIFLSFSLDSFSIIPTVPTTPPRYEVESIKTTSTLVSGSKNDGTRTAKQDGMLYKQSYDIEIESFVGGKKPPKDVKIHWEYGYVGDKDDESPGMSAPVVIGGLGITTEHKISIEINSLDMLGKVITIYAYIEDKTKGANLDLWAHYRFRHFDRKKVMEQVEDRKKNPWKINQGQTPLCGMAAIFYLFAKYNYNEYEKFVTNLHRVGFVTHNGYTVAPFKGNVKIAGSKLFGIIPIVVKKVTYIDVSEEMYSMDPLNTGKYPYAIPEADWIAMATTRSRESTIAPLGLLKVPLIYKGEKEALNAQQLLAVNWPWMLRDLCKKLLGYEHAKDAGYVSYIAGNKVPQLLNELPAESDNKYVDKVLKKIPKLQEKAKRSPIKALQDLQQIDELHRNKQHKILLMIDSQMLDNEVSNSTSDIFNNLHWVVYEGGLKMFDANKTRTYALSDVKYVSFEIFTWGEDIINSRITKQVPGLGITIESFNSTYYGYVECWNTKDETILIDSPISPTEIPNQPNNNSNNSAYA